MNTDRCVPEKKKKKKHQFGHFFLPFSLIRKRSTFQLKRNDALIFSLLYPWYLENLFALKNNALNEYIEFEVSSYA